jgi:hypothetical protein
MTGDPTRLLHDPATAAVLRRDLGAASEHVAFDVDAGLARLQSSLAVDLAHGTGASVGASGGFAVGALVLAGGLAALLGWQIAGPTATPQALSVTRGDAVARAVEVVPTAVVPTAAPVVAPIEAIEVDAVEEDVEPAAAAKSPRVRRPRGERSDAAVAGGAGGDYLREARELNAARSLLGVDAARALTLAEAGAAEFRAGTFVQEWEGVAVLAMFELGRSDAARVRARAFLERYPSGTYAPRIRQAIDRLP